MNAIEIVGYVAIYLVIGWVLSPIDKSMNKHYASKKANGSREVFIAIWPFLLFLVIVVVWLDGAIKDD